MKIVINKCYGGFNLSPAGVKRYFELKGEQVYIYQMSALREYQRVDNIDDIYSSFVSYTTSDQGEFIIGWLKDEFYVSTIARNNPALVQVVEELGEKSSSANSNLVVEEIENGRWYKIDEYDGYETIEYRDIDDEWQLAEDVN